MANSDCKPPSLPGSLSRTTAFCSLYFSTLNCRFSNCWCFMSNRYVSNWCYIFILTEVYFSCCYLSLELHVASIPDSLIAIIFYNDKRPICAVFCDSGFFNCTSDRSAKCLVVLQQHFVSCSEFIHAPTTQSLGQF